MKKEQDYIENKSRERERNYWQDAVRARSRAQHGKRAFVFSRAPKPHTEIYQNAKPSIHVSRCRLVSTLSTLSLSLSLTHTHTQTERICAHQLITLALLEKCINQKLKMSLWSKKVPDPCSILMKACARTG